MNRFTEQKLLAFCATQHSRFNPGAWAEFQRRNPDELSCAAQTLSRARWYGHLNDLQAFVSEQVRPQKAAVSGSDEAARCGFNRERFVQRLREQLWARQEPKR
jgi:hypothetical protein